MNHGKGMNHGNKDEPQNQGWTMERGMSHGKGMNHGNRDEPQKLGMNHRKEAKQPSKVGMLFEAKADDAWNPHLTCTALIARRRFLLAEARRSRCTVCRQAFSHIMQQVEY